MLYGHCAISRRILHAPVQSVINPPRRFVRCPRAHRKCPGAVGVVGCSREVRCSFPRGLCTGARARPCTEERARLSVPHCSSPSPQVWQCGGLWSSSTQ
ncbi:hypothetical protein AMELA_G00149040 [Ameiurus melas]|uniref:Uncharacterized protein n=1 Tax=Ameiurus melas TaxID=219545 RepID=A0A7J6AH27_AMEME|nr:hypothetical protein AMELA_G00149040 [Ameiurus melas]